MIKQKNFQKIHGAIAFLSNFLIGLFLTVNSGAQEITTQEFIREKVEQIREFGSLQIGNEPISAIIAITEFYEQRNFTRAWTDQTDIEGLIKSIHEMEEDGLKPSDYHFEDLASWLKQSQIDKTNPENLANFDILLTDAFYRLAYHVLFGKVDPESLDPNWNINREIDELHPAEILENVLNSPSVYQFIREHKPQNRIYLELKGALAEYRQISENGGWDNIPEGKVLKTGMSDERIPMLRKRLIISKDLEQAHDDTSLIYDDILEKAVKLFQFRHGLKDDGVVGNNTLLALNVPIEKRIKQLMINLERARWVLHEAGQDMILVNIAGFNVSLIKNYQVIWRSRVQVGKDYRQTPIFKSKMQYLVFNPTWTVPPTILKNDVLPAIKRDPSYLQKKNMSVLTRGGQKVDPAQIDWSTINANSFPYIIRQEPGPINALGKVKFIFPNKHFVYLHDTPSKILFEKETRTFSSGCIRVEYPLEFAEILLNDSLNWNLKRIDELITSKKTQTVYLDNPLPVFLLYWTAFPNIETDWKLHFRQDIYNRDDKIFAGLKEEFKIRESILRMRNSKQ